MAARRRNQRRQTVEQLLRCPHQADAATRPRLHALIDQVLGIDFTQALQRKCRTGAVAQQTLQTLALVGLDAHLGIHREAATVLPLAHHLHIVGRQQDAPLSRAQQSTPHSRLNLGYCRCIQSVGRVKDDAASCIALENAIHQDAVEARWR